MKKKIILGAIILILIAGAGTWLVFLNKKEAIPNVSQNNINSSSTASASPTPASTVTNTSTTVQAQTFPYAGIAKAYPSFKVASINSAEKTFDYVGCGPACQADITIIYKVVPETNIITNQMEVPFQDIAVGDNVMVRGIPQTDGSILVKQVFLNVTSSEKTIFVTGVDLKNMILNGNLYDGTSTQNIDPAYLSKAVTLQIIPQTEVGKGIYVVGQQPIVPLSDLKVGDLADILEMQQGENWVALDINVESSHPSQ